MSNKTVSVKKWRGPFSDAAYYGDWSWSTSFDDTPNVFMKPKGELFLPLCYLVPLNLSETILDFVRPSDIVYEPEGHSAFRH